MEAEEKPQLPDEAWTEALAAIRELAGFLDADGVEGILNELVSYELSDEKAEQVSAMRKALQQLDWDFLGGV